MVNRRNSNQSSQRTLLLTLGGCLVILLCILFVSLLGLGGLYFYHNRDTTIFSESQIVESAAPILTPVPASPTIAPLATLPAENNISIPATPLAPTTAPPTAVPLATAPPISKKIIGADKGVHQEAVPERAFEDLHRLYETDQPVYDYFEVYKNFVLPGEDPERDIGPRSYQRPAFQIGNRQVFRTNDGSIEATLVKITDHAYFWVDDNLDYDEADVRAAALRLESQEYFGQLSHLFGTPWEPGMDGDPHFSVVHLARSGNEYELGYFSDLDEYPNTLPLFSESNQQEAIYLNMDQLEFGSDLYFGTLLHELQHLAQWNLDKNESIWLNEGLSQLAELYVGLNTANPDAYMEQPHVRLDRWEYGDKVIDAHYANSFLFVVYLWEQLGESALTELIRQPANGLSSIRKVLQGAAPDRTLEQFLADWAAANYLDDPAAGFQYSYTKLAPPAPALISDSVNDPVDTVMELDQLSVHYYNINQSGDLNIQFAGDTTAKLIEAPPTSGSQMWFALPGNDTHAQLTRKFDLRQLSQATLEFNAWYDLEEEYDFAYVTVSTDQGGKWTALAPQHVTSGDYGPAFSGYSPAQLDANNGWVHEQISLNDFVGQEVLVSFQVLSDFEAVGQGFALDDISVPELGYADNVESSASEWQAEGFVQTSWLLPQLWSVQVIHQGSPPQVTSLQLDEFNQYIGTINMGSAGGAVVVMPLTPFTFDQTRYVLKVSK